MLQEGDKAPNFQLKADNGKKVSLKDFLGQTVVLYFYPKDMTSGCTQQACAFRDAQEAFKKHNAVILGVSGDPLASHIKFKEKYQLPFLLLVDDTTKTSDAYGVWQKKSMYGRSYMGIERSTFILNEKGIILQIFRKVKVKNHIKTILDFLTNRTTAS